MLKRSAVVVCAAALGLGSASAANYIWEWGGAPSSHYNIEQFQRHVVIKSAGTYEFAASGDEGGGLGTIDLIDVQYDLNDPNCPDCTSGPVYIYVTKENDTGHDGAALVGAIDLSGATEGYIATVRARDSLATYGDIVATNVDFMSTGDIVHDVVLDALDGFIWCQTLGNLTANNAPDGQIAVFDTCTGIVDLPGSIGLVAIVDLLGSVSVGGTASEVSIGDMGEDAVLKVDGELVSLDVDSDVFNGYVHVIGTLDNLFAYGEFGSAARVVVDGDLAHQFQVAGGALAGTLAISGSAGASATIKTWYGPLSGSVSVGTLAGSVYVGAGTGADLTGSLAVANDASGLIDINGDLTGQLDVGGTLFSTVQVAGEMPYPSSVQVGGEFYGSLYTDALAGSIHIGGDMTGLIDVTNRIGDDDPNHPFAGHIRVNGAFRAHEGGDAPLIQAYDMTSPRSYITFDYDATNDPWEAGAEVVFTRRPVTYTQNTPSARVWHTVYCLADMNNDGNINSADGTPFGTGPFFLALSNPAQYALDFPGLGEANPDWDPINPLTKPRFLSGPVLFHGDCNCDATFNEGDRTAFLDLVSSHACTNCEGQDGLSRIPAEELATEIVANVDPEILPDTPVLMAPTIEAYADQPEAQAYWQAVEDNITP